MNFKQIISVYNYYVEIVSKIIIQNVIFNSCILMVRDFLTIGTSLTIREKIKIHIELCYLLKIDKITKIFNR